VRRGGGDALALLASTRGRRDTQELDELADEFIRSRGGTRPSRATAATASICARRTRWSSTASPASTRCGRRHPLRGRRRDARRLCRRFAYTFAIGEVSEEASACSRAARPRLPPDRAVPRGQPPLGHLARDPGRDRGAGLLRGPQPGRPRRRPLDARRAQIRTTASRAAPAAREGMTFAIEPMITAAARTSSCTTTSGRSPARTARSPRTSSTPSRSRPTAADPDRRDHRRPFVSDPRIEQYAKLLSRRASTSSRLAGARRWSALARPLLEEVSRAVARRGAYACCASISRQRDQRAVGGRGTGRAARDASELDAYMWKHADALVSIEAPENTRELTAWRSNG